MGHSAYVAELATRLCADHDVHIFANTFDERSDHLTFHHVPASRINAFASIVSFIPFADFCTRGQFDILHAQGLCGLSHNVATAHFCQAAWFAALREQQTKLDWRQQIFKNVVSPLERLALTRPKTRTVIAVSNLVRNNMSDFYGRSSDVEVIYHGVDSRRFHPDNRGQFRHSLRSATRTSQDEFVAIYVGDLKKGANAAIKAVAKAEGVTLWCVTASNTAAYSQLADALGVADRVRFFPRTRDVEQYFSAADAFLFPTLYDPFGLVITEAMASGLPVITSKNAGAAELISHGSQGLLTDAPWDDDSIAENLALLRDSKTACRDIGDAARKVAEGLTWDATTEKTLKIYERIYRETRE
ncbi:MAG: glycosyltransferase family 4 protein [Pirellulales bacterium]